MYHNLRIFMLAELATLPLPTTLMQALSFTERGKQTEVNVARQTLTDKQRHQHAVIIKPVLSLQHVDSNLKVWATPEKCSEKVPVLK